ncbi:MAG: hypothetical protein A2Y62_05815 [Candidatus Fischerbacteria bacterium RBG_13_37_8]|uniref:CAAX prenyl protease 2/Lysostaphin resistance protein A-like domain-containing protein n=1 Tax=Candidatus Fischerbacteria bacterium RBG_13_37_8 TaxID=1817863 RepID=A0A1F5VD82_9BACT|nr:MAG: hypothetical protein A2Y62_05815 [Candidatus Fischerbacteria bacterium RBG_13_37_8]
MAITSSKYTLPIYVLLTFLISWSLWFTSGIFSRPAPAEIRDFPWFIAQLGVFMPSILALLFFSLSGNQKRKVSLAAIFLIFIPVVLLGAWIAAAAPDKILHLNSLHAIIVIIVALWVMVFFSSLNPCQKDLGLEPQSSLKRTGWILLSLLFLPALFLISWVLASFSGGVFTATVLTGNVTKVLWSIILLFAFNLLCAGALGEEIGWRGFVLPRLLEKSSPLRASFILAVIWASWHLPIDIRYGFGLTGAGGIVVRFLWTWPLTIIFTWFYLRSKKSLLVPLLLHASINMLSDFGFSNYEQTISVMFLIQIPVAIILGFRLSGKLPFDSSK